MPESGTLRVTRHRRNSRSSQRALENDESCNIGLERTAHLGKVKSMLAVRERWITEDALIVERARSEVALRLTGDAVIRTDALGLIEYLNPVAQKITAWSATAASRQPIEDVFCIFHEKTREVVPNPVLDCLNADETIETGRYTILINRLGHEFSIKGSAAPVRGRDDGVHGAVLVFSDLTEARRMAREISHQANHDALTGLMNRGAFEAHLQRVLTTARRDGSQHVLCVLDLDQFKMINDTCGHFAGDELLRQFAQCLRESVPARSSTSRIGADEFSILMRHRLLEEAESVIGALRQSIEEFRFSWDGQSLRIGASFGLVPITAHNESVSAILRAADAACETAKGRGRNRIHVAEEDDVEIVHRHGEMQWVARINDALENDRFCLFFQPIEPLTVEPSAGAHFELLLRMIGDEGVILPSEFLPVAERYVLAARIDRWVFERALHWLSADSVRLAGIEQCTINLSGQSLGDEEFLELVLDNLQSTPDIAKKICFEITETAAIHNLRKGIRFITTLKEQGCRFALDDFGSGLSSFGYLKSLPVDYLKIDGQFVRDILIDPIDLAMVKSIHDIAKVMGKSTIAEFVESAEILESLKGIGIDFVQGHAIAPPRALQRFPAG